MTASTPLFSADSAAHARRLVPSPMALVRRFTSSNESARAAAVYFENTGVRGKKFGQTNAPLMAALAEVQQEVERQMQGLSFFISMLPEHTLHAQSEHRTPILDAQCIPAFAQGVALVARLLASNPDIQHACDVRIEVDTGRQFCEAHAPARLNLVVIERIPKPAGRGTTARIVDLQTLTGGKPQELYPGDEWAQELLRWYAGSSGGLVQWTWRPQTQ